MKSDLEATADKIRREYGIRDPVELLRSDLASVSMAWGLLHHWVILPTESDQWPLAKSEAVLRHELSHIKRRDNFVQGFVLLVSAFYWLNPLVWFALRKIHFEREAACDDAVINSGTRASTYARYLMEVAQRLSGPKNESIQPAVMAHSSDLKRRLVRVLDTESKRHPIGRVRATIYTVVALLAALPLSALRPWAMGTDPSESAVVELGGNVHAGTGFRHFGQGWALRFNGRSSHVIVPDGDEFNFQGDFTIEARIRVSDLDRADRNHILIAKHRSHGQGGEWAMIIEGPPNPKGRLVFEVWKGTDSNSVCSLPGVISADGSRGGTWQELAFCYSATSHQWRFFVDGEVVGAGVDHLDIGRTSRDLWIGWESNEPHHDFEGWIRAMRISDTVRYDSRYEPGLDLQTDKATIAHWDFEGVAATTLKDMSGNGHHGVVFDCDREEFVVNEILVSPGEDLQSVVDSAPDGSLITLLPGVHAGSMNVDGRALSIRGSGADRTSLDAERSRDFALLVVNGGVLRLSDLTLTRCYNDQPVEYYYPAALTVDGGRVELVRCRFEDNLNAVAVWRSGSRIHASHSTILAGEAVAVLTREASLDSEVFLANCTLVGTRSDQGHGLIKMWGGGLDVNRCVLSAPRGRAIEYHGGTWVGDCNIVHAAVQVSGGLVLPENHRNVDPRLGTSQSWRYDVLPESPSLPDNNECGEHLGSSGRSVALVGPMSEFKDGADNREVW